MSEKEQKIKAEENDVTQAETIEAKQVSEEKTVQMQSFSEVLREQIHEDETAPASQKLSIIKILGGDFFTSQILRRQILLMIYISIFIIIYISNRYSCQNSMHEIENLKEELQDMKFKALSTSSRLTEQSRQSKVLQKLKENKDSVLHIATQPPFIINVPEENTTTAE